MSTLDSVKDLQQRMSASIIGQEDVVKNLVIGLLANGNVLMEGLPGLAKTRAVKGLAKNMDADFSRIQFTPDLLPSDITGSEVLYTEAGAPSFRFEQGPIFANIVLADEINRAPAKVQAALLEAMEERQVTVSGTTHKMPELFMVMATQNPIEQEGTYPLPEAQMDRFLMHVYIDYPDEESEGKIIRLVRGEEGDAPAQTAADPVAQGVIFAAREEIQAVTVGPAIERYMVDLVFATRYPDRYSEQLAKWIHVGVSPRGGIALDKCSRAHAWLDSRQQVLPDDVRAICHGVLRHRLKLSYDASADGVSANDVIDEILQQVAIA
ncbi:MAG: MoxR family ATPase [Xanthomonadales bacterium]|nr:MoxR family ATPase [Gammaproteobacteria bacterium]MBT8052563.1 MoxR family ATPase [Gammaproteobacteria bacterium]NND57756.1 MoxR family ATPase [Xanthomonadales bacterium]NNK51471.1 MoxR family ATPase [Xanthomonadales bacterium]